MGNEKRFLKNIPPGYRFKPSDEELIVYYLKRKVYNEQLPENMIEDVDLYAHKPEDLATEAYRSYGEKEWYFFTPRNRKYPNGKRPNRTAGDGYWKASDADKDIFTSNGELVGKKKTLVFYRGKQSLGNKTDWLMQEYKLANLPQRQRTDDGDMQLDEWVLCRLYRSYLGKRAKRSADDTAAGDHDVQRAVIPLPPSHQLVQAPNMPFPHTVAVELSPQASVNMPPVEALDMALLPQQTSMLQQNLHQKTFMPHLHNGVAVLPPSQFAQAPSMPLPVAFELSPQAPSMPLPVAFELSPQASVNMPPVEAPNTALLPQQTSMPQQNLHQTTTFMPQQNLGSSSFDIDQYLKMDWLSIYMALSQRHDQ